MAILNDMPKDKRVLAAVKIDSAITDLQVLAGSLRASHPDMDVDFATRKLRDLSYKMTDLAKGIARSIPG